MKMINFVVNDLIFRKARGATAPLASLIPAPLIEITETKIKKET